MRIGWRLGGGRRGAGFSHGTEYGGNGLSVYEVRGGFPVLKPGTLYRETTTVGSALLKVWASVFAVMFAVSIVLLVRSPGDPLLPLVMLGLSIFVLLVLFVLNSLMDRAPIRIFTSDGAHTIVSKGRRQVELDSCDVRLVMTRTKVIDASKWSLSVRSESEAECLWCEIGFPRGAGRTVLLEIGASDGSEFAPAQLEHWMGVFGVADVDRKSGVAYGSVSVIT